MLKALIKTMRPHQWTKNIFVFAALVFDQKLFKFDALQVTLTAFIIFCFLSSSVYIINDIMDVEADREHPKKKNRPIASGKLPIRFASLMATVFVVGSLSAAFIITTQFGLLAVIYFTLNLAYSKWLKHIPLVDVMIIATGFVLRTAAGVSVIEVERFSPWLYVCTTLLALYIGFGKRRSELFDLENGNGNGNQRKVLDGYTINLLDQLIMINSSTTIIAYSLYTFSAPNLPDNHMMMLTIPFVIYGIFRYLYLIQVKGKGGEPDEIVLIDRPLQIDIALWGVFVFTIFYIF
jgi:4-hydroxybenzoate polyprenyltransferase